MPNGIASTMNILSNSDPIHPSGDIITFNHEQGGQNESNQEDSDVSEESLQSGSLNEFSTEKFLYQTAAIDTVMGTTDDSLATAFICGQQSNILTTAN